MTRSNSPANRDAPGALKQSTFFALLALIALLGLGLRAYGLTDLSFWIDEGFSHYAATELDLHFENTPPLYFVLLHVWIRLFGEGEAAIRSLSVVFGVAGIWTVGVFGRTFINARVGLLAAALTAVSFYPIHYSREARAFGLLMLLTVVSYFCLLRVPRSATRLNWLLYILATALLCYTHYYFLFIVLAQNLYVWYCYRDERTLLRSWFLSQAAVVFLFLPWLLILLRQTRRIMTNGFWISRPQPSVEALQHFVSFLTPDLVIVIYIAIAVWGLWMLRRDSTYFSKPIPDRARLPEVLLALWLICPILVPFLISQVATPILVSRYVLCAAPAFYLMLAIGWQRLPNRVLRAGVLCLWAAVAGWSYYKYDNVELAGSAWERPRSAFPVQPFREWHAVLRPQFRETDVLLIMPNFQGLAFNYYNRHEIPVETLSTNRLTREETIREVTSLTAGKQRLWVLYGERSTEIALAAFRERYHETRMQLPRPMPNSRLHLSLFDLRRPAVTSRETRGSKKEAK